MTGRKKIEIDLKAVEEAAAEGLNEAEVAARVGVSEDTLRRRKKGSVAFVEAIARGRHRAHAEVSSKLFEKVRAGDLGAIVWYEKTRKGYSDRVDNNNNNSATTVHVIYEKRSDQADRTPPGASGNPD